jgi:transcriptional regulator with GAF, ATPase, and Fis domain
MRLRRRSDPDIFAGSSGVMAEIDHLIRQVATTDVTVLIEGESGTGKEIVARAIHERSRRSTRPFIAVNCAALPENLLESELFGHVRGAFTGAISDRKGRFQLAHKGTLFLDEIADLSPKGQADLLRVLEDASFRPVGSQKAERADARIIAASNKSLEAESMNGRFREDLLYRLNVVTMHLPPLRERAEDIPQLVKSFTEHYCVKHRRQKKRFSLEVVGVFRTYSGLATCASFATSSNVWSLPFHVRRLASKIYLQPYSLLEDRTELSLSDPECLWPKWRRN